MVRGQSSRLWRSSIVAARRRISTRRWRSPSADEGTDRGRAQAADELERLQSQIDDVLAGMQIDPSMYELPPVDIPAANPTVPS